RGAPGTPSPADGPVTAQEAAAGPLPSVATSTVATVAEPAGPAPAPVPAASSTPAPTTITVTIHALPADVEVWRDGRKIGVASSPLDLPRRDGVVELTLRKPGWLDKTVEIPTSEP